MQILLESTQFNSMRKGDFSILADRMLNLGSFAENSKEKNKSNNNNIS